MTQTESIKAHYPYTVASIQDNNVIDFSNQDNSLITPNQNFLSSLSSTSDPTQSFQKHSTNSKQKK